MNHKRNRRPLPPAPNCVQCAKRPQVAGRDDKLCPSCAHFADMAKRLVQK